jgi:hypothetical protein
LLEGVEGFHEMLLLLLLLLLELVLDLLSIVLPLLPAVLCGLALSRTLGYRLHHPSFLRHALEKC